MSKAGQKSVFRWDSLTEGKAKKLWTYLFLFFIYGMVSVGLSHLSEQKARKMYRLVSENRKLKAEYVMLKSRLMKRQLRLNVYNRLKDKGFILPKRNPKMIVVKDE